MGKKILASIFLGYLDLSRDFFGHLNIQYNLKIRDSSQVSWPRSSVNKVKPNLFCDCFLIFNALHRIFSIKPVNRICSWVSRVLLQRPPDAKKVLTKNGVKNKQTQMFHY